MYASEKRNEGYECAVPLQFIGAQRKSRVLRETTTSVNTEIIILVNIHGEDNVNE